MVSGPPPVVRPPLWSDDELLAATEAYLFMLKQELEGGTYVKADINRQLRAGALAERNSSSVELRMQNISAVLLEMQIPYLRGYVPAVNIGSGVIKRLKIALEQAGIAGFKNFARTADPRELEVRTSALLEKSEPLGRPAGTIRPEQVPTTSTVFARDPAVRAWVLRSANGSCEGCGNKAPFQTMGGLPFLEVHHVVPLASGGSDTLGNTVALCPNCHRRCHLSVDRDEFKLSLYERIRRLQVELPTEPDLLISELIGERPAP